MKNPPTFEEWRKSPSLNALYGTWVEYVLMGFAVAFSLYWFAFPFTWGFLDYLWQGALAVLFFWVILQIIKPFTDWLGIK